MSAMDAADAILREQRAHEELADVITRTRVLMQLGPPTAEAIESLGGGWVGEEALGIALLCAATADHANASGVADALWRAVFHSGDSDSTGSITGNLLGAMVGMEGLPARWLGQLEMRTIIERLATDLYVVSIKHGEHDYMAYPPN
jgi:ADP-ribosyl-[dinitrogen reductase] hydrolase